jgi:hypothetical protein
MTHYDQTLDLVTGFLDEERFRYHVCEDAAAIDTGLEGDHAFFPVQIQLLGEEPRRGIEVRVRVPVVVPETHRAVMAEAIARANYGLHYGFFTLDMSDGEMTLVAAMPLYDGTVTYEQIACMLYGAVSTANDYTRAFLRLIYAEDLSPAEVIAEVEMS